jgi:phage terminase small subunit
MKRLTPREVRFVQEYMIDLCGTAAAIRAGYSRRSANSSSSRLMAQLHVKKAIREAMDARARMVGITAEKVLAEISTVAFSDLKDHVKIRDGEVRVYDFEGMPDGSSRALESVSDTRDAKGAGKISVKLYNKMQALAMLAAHLGICRESVAVTGADGKPLDATLTVKVVSVKDGEGDGNPGI